MAAKLSPKTSHALMPRSPAYTVRASTTGTRLTTSGGMNHQALSCRRGAVAVVMSTVVT